MLSVTAGPPNVVIILSATKAAIVISKRIQSDALGEDSLDGLLTLGQYLHPDEGALEAIQAATARCPEEIGIGNRVRFVRSSLENFLAGIVIEEPFDYVDVAAPVGRRKGGRGKGLRRATEYVDTLGLLIPNVRPSACMIV